MESVIGTVRRIDDLGRIVIPKGYRRSMSISEGDTLELLMTEEGVLLRPYNHSHADKIKAIANEIYEVENSPEYVEIVKVLRRIARDLEILEK